MILSFTCKEIRKVFYQEVSHKLPRDIQVQALRKLLMLASATNLHDLRSPPGNRLEALKGNRKGQHSIRINDQWRICFCWRDSNAHDVEITDYH
ncbi:MAG: type II toxin-antitoxin system RelE/ParE family toxin [Desulfovibrio sp.]|nr:MAG: type II toxin-antitoxin system RelE/ParE family toxin [Desulfovibrio sp.]